MWNHAVLEGRCRTRLKVRVWPALIAKPQLTLNVSNFISNRFGSQFCGPSVVTSLGVCRITCISGISFELVTLITNFIGSPRWTGSAALAVTQTSSPELQFGLLDANPPGEQADREHMVRITNMRRQITSRFMIASIWANGYAEGGIPFLYNTSKFDPLVS
jgi:hypothetical protein